MSIPLTMNYAEGLIADMQETINKLNKLCDERGSNEARMFIRCRELFDEVSQMQEQNTHLDKVSAELQDTCDRQAKMLGELLAVMHRDGGHYTQEHGLHKAVTDAKANWYELIGEIDRLNVANTNLFDQGQKMFNELERLRKEIERLQAAASDPQLLTSNERRAVGERILMQIKHGTEYVK